MPNVTKKEIVADVTNKLESHTQQEVAAIVQAVIDSMEGFLAQGRAIELRNFGSFEVRYTPPKIGRNPRDAGKDIPIPARAIVKFKPGRVLRDKVSMLLPQLEQGMTPPRRSRKNQGGA